MFKQKDYKQTGFVSVVSFKEILKLTKSDLNEEDMYKLIQRLDKDITGMVNYNKFISDYLKMR
jgi:Ca2+-binding EF-hand superfamily protein